ncbi:unnamed protein product [Prorocentrum cordatum]|uniref:Uncharacterized protein n=1 Tax=Prorocentrum cordatum TaxID=2364126 RepID=A0ABN9S138_9DINO|nr:unnamed protein product [Polarella glacialis]
MRGTGLHSPRVGLGGQSWWPTSRVLGKIAWNLFTSDVCLLCHHLGAVESYVATSKDICTGATRPRRPSSRSWLILFVSQGGTDVSRDRANEGGEIWLNRHHLRIQHIGAADAACRDLISDGTSVVDGFTATILHQHGIQSSRSHSTATVPAASVAGTCRGTRVLEHLPRSFDFHGLSQGTSTCLLKV